MMNLKNVIEDLVLDAVDAVLTEDFCRGVVLACLDDVDIEKIVRNALTEAVRDQIDDALSEALAAAIEGVM